MDPLLDFASIDNLLRTAVGQPLIPEAEPSSVMSPMPMPMGPPPALAAPDYYNSGTMATRSSAPAPKAAPVANAEPLIPLPDYSKVKGIKPMAPQELPLFANMIRRVESSHNYQAKNPSTSASGAYQYINRTWNNYGGYPEARLAPKAVQDAKFNEDAARKLAKFNGDPFKMIADHMLPAQANHPERWTRPSTIMVRGKPVHIPPVAEYVAKVVKGSPWESQFQQYLKAHGAP